MGTRWWPHANIVPNGWNITAGAAHGCLYPTKPTGGGAECLYSITSILPAHVDQVTAFGPRYSVTIGQVAEGEGGAGGADGGRAGNWTIIYCYRCSFIWRINFTHFVIGPSLHSCRFVCIKGCRYTTS